MEDNKIYGEASADEQVKITFGRGSIRGAVMDKDFPGAIDFGYYTVDPETGEKQYGYGVTCIEGHIASSRIVDCEILGAENEPKTVKFYRVDDEGYVRTMEVEALDKQLIEALIHAATEEAIAGIVFPDIPEVTVPLYNEGDYIGIEHEENGIDYKVRVRYPELYAKIKDDLAAAGIGDHETINTQQNERILAIENSFLKDIENGEVSEDEKTRQINVTVSKRASEGEESVETTFTFDIPTDYFYENLDTEIATMKSAIANKRDKDEPVSVEWEDVHELLEHERENA
jgi:hypothetical protein